MAVKTRQWLIGGAVVVAVGVALEVRGRYRRWKREQLERLEAESQVLMTALGRVEYRMEGSGPVVLLVHGSQGGYDTARAYARVLDIHASTLLSLSRPGYLRTPLSSGVTPEEQADLYAATLDTLDIASVVVVAISGGAPSALQFALRHPSRCSGLVLISGLAQRSTQAERYRTLSWNERLSVRFSDAFSRYDPVVYLLHLLTRFSPEGEASEESQLVSAMSLSHLRMSGFRNDKRQFARLPRYPVQNIAVPTLILHGTADTGIPFEQALHLAQVMPNAQLQAFEGGDHLFLLSPLYRDKANASIQAFLQQLTPSLKNQTSGK